MNDWRTMTPEEAACGRCDQKPAGAGAVVLIDPAKRFGLIVACALCKKEIERETSFESRRRAIGF